MLVLEVVGGVLVNDETDRDWSEAIFAFTVAVIRCAFRLIKVTDVTRCQGSAAKISRLLQHRYIYNTHSLHKSNNSMLYIPRITVRNAGTI